MNFPQHRRKKLIPFAIPLFFLFCLITPAHSLIIPPDPFESTDRFALLNPTPDGTITQVVVKLKAHGPDPLGPGELWALLQYKLYGNNKLLSSASSAISIQGLNNTASTLIKFDFSNKLIPAGAYHRTLLIYYQETSDTLPMRVAEYRPEQLFLNPSANAFQPPSPPPSGTLIFGPITFLREREIPKTEQVSFTISDTTGPFLLRLTNGTPDGAQRVSSALIKLNGSEVFRPPQFNQNVSTLSRQVTLLSGENSLEVRLRSAPGSFVTIELFRLDQHACPALGLHTFTRSTRKPVKETMTFDLPPKFVEPFVFNLTSGNPDGSNRVDSATITLNGILIFDPNDFNEQTGFLSQGVSLLPTNTLNVQLSGAPGDLLTVEIIGYDNTPPSVTILSPPNGVTFTTSPITVRGMVDDPLASVTVNGIPATVQSDSAFTLEGITLQEGENTIRVIATDSCGNRGEDQILVYLRTLPEGPQLVFCIEPGIIGIAKIMGAEFCLKQDFTRDYGRVIGYTDETAVSLTLNGILLPDGLGIYRQGDIYYGIREGTHFWADLNIPPVDGIHLFTAVAADANGNQTQATVTFIRDTVPPRLIITSPGSGLVTNNPTIVIAGTVDDPNATVTIGWGGPPIFVVKGTFETQFTLDQEGLNFLDITAWDPAYNVSYVTLKATVDTIPPQINVTTPVEGVTVNAPTIQVAGIIIDQNIETINVAVNNGQPQSLTLTGSNFSGTVTLSSGSNTLTFHATDKAGNPGSLARSVLLDLESPAVAITVPQPGAVISGVVTVTAEASDAMSGITSVTLYMDGQMQTTLSHTPFNFTLNTSTFISGLHTITVRAKDRAGNESEASVSVTIDNVPPIAAIITPLSGAVVSGLITVSVQANDPNSGMASVSLYVDGLLQATLTQPPFNFSLNTLLFASGSHTLTARGIDKAGNQADASIVISFDHVPPAVSITSPTSGAMVSGLITVSVEATDSISGVASVTLYVNNQPHSTLTQAPFNFAVDTSGLAPGLNTLAARAIDRVGNQGESNITITVMEGMRIEITSPPNGTAINKSSAIVQGRINNQTGEIGVVVNGILANVQGNDFAVIVPLQIGQNIITAAATRSDGVQAQASITINTETQEEFVRLNATPTNGILDQTGILNVTLEAEPYLINPVSSYSWDFNGDGTPEIIGTETTVIAQYQFPGIYFPRVTVTDNQENVYTQATIVHVLSREEMDALLRLKWEGMKTALTNKNIPMALDDFIDPSKEVYQQAFNVIIDELPQIISNMQDIEVIFLYNNIAKYRINRLHNIDGILHTITYYIYFVKDLDGIWRIDRF